MIRVLSICLLSLFAMSLSFNNEVKTEQHFSKNYKIASSGKQQLIVFLQANDAFFKADCLPKIEKLTKEKGIELIVKNAEDGAPEDLTSTPSVIYQNAAGRSIFAARYAEFATVENFIRTSRAVSQQRVLNCKQNVLVWNEGRMQVASPVKITALGGVKTKDFDENAFKTKAFEVIDKAMSKFNATAEACLLKTDRAFYLDFHPYRSADDKLFLSFEMFSQFSCVKPIFSELKTPLTGNFSDFETLFAQAAVVLEKEIVAQMQDSKIGDAVTPLSKSTKISTFDDLGLSLPMKENGNRLTITQAGTLPTSWTLAGAVDPEIPMLQFKFPEPLDRYAGEVKEFFGSLKTDENKQITEGSFEVNTASMTMGMEDLDVKVHKKYIYCGKFPKSTFRFTALPKGTILKWGQTTSADIAGEFQLMKTKKAITVKTDLTPTVGSKGEILLAVQATFSINITDDFGIAGPDGPEPAKKTLLFNLNFFMQPTPSVKAGTSGQ